jgi:hypothetical protein
MATEAWKVCQVMSAVVPDPPVLAGQQFRGSPSNAPEISRILCWSCALFRHGFNVTSHRGRCGSDHPGSALDHHYAQ